MLRGNRQGITKSMKTHLRLNPRETVFQRRKLWRTVQKYSSAVRHPDVPYDAVDPVRIRLKFIKAKVIACDQEDHRTGADADGQTQNVYRSIKRVIADLPPG